MGNILLVSGSDTGVGKTIVTAALASYLQHHYPQQHCSILKPIQSGIGDREFYADLLPLSQTLDEITPIFLETPIAPPIAAAVEGKIIDLALAWQALQRLQSQSHWTLIEGVGGLGTPITDEWTVAHLAQAWHLPTLLVIPMRLGAVGQAVAQAALARQFQLNVCGIVISCLQPCTRLEQEQLAPQTLIERLTQLPVLGYLSYCAPPVTAPRLTALAAQLHLEPIFGTVPHPVPRFASH